MSWWRVFQPASPRASPPATSSIQIFGNKQAVTRVLSCDPPDTVPGCQLLLAATPFCGQTGGAGYPRRPNGGTAGPNAVPPPIKGRWRARDPALE